MSLQNENSDSVRRYLLGELSEDEREQVEQRLMTEDDLYQQLLLAEDDLVDEYVSDTFPKHDRDKFAHFLQVPELRQDVKFAAALRKHALKVVPQATTEVTTKAARASLLDWFRAIFMRPATGISLAVALLTTSLLATWLATQNSRLRRQVEQLHARQTPTPAPPQELQEELTSQRLRNEQLSAELRREQELRAEMSRTLQQPQDKQPTPTQTPKPSAESRAFVAFTLTPGLVRESGEWKKFSLNPGTREVRMRLDIPTADHRNYQATLKTVDGREVLHRQGLRPAAGNFVVFVIPARLLNPDDYQILLSSLASSGESEEIGRYYFRVLK
jgi:hypothetical protein